MISVVLAGASLAACQGAREEEPSALTRVSAGTITAGDRVPSPEGEAVLRVRGVAGGPGRAAPTAMDLATLERLPRVRLTVYEPFRKRDMTFEGVRLADLVRIAGAPRSTGGVYMHALDDYHVELPLAELASDDAVLATRADGKRIPIAAGGPLRLVFPARSELGRNTDNWIWNVDWIRADP